MIVKTRFAPSPTGNLHFGNIRTALYSWLFARKKGGKFILRIEDTNSEYIENNNDTINNIIEIMKWLRLDWDEGPYFQTHRFDRYNYIIQYMLKNNIAYKCYCSLERLSLIRSTQIKNGEKPKYDGYCRNKSEFYSINKTYYNNMPHVIRFCNPISGKVTFKDQIRGVITFDNKELDDLVLKRANGIPTYNFCVVIDDMDMNITHVVRGEEHINNTPRQINILKALNAEIPVYAHVPMIVDSNGKKLSKRYDHVGIMQYRKDGFLPEAILNYLIRLGWSYGNEEIFSINQMQEYFDFNKVNKSVSIFNFKKLLWYNHYYINHLPIEYIVSYLLEYMNMQFFDYKNDVKLFDVMKLFSNRFYTLKEVMVNFNYLFNDFDFFDKEMSKKYLIPVVAGPLKLIRKKLNDINNWTLDIIKFSMKEFISKLSTHKDLIRMSLRFVLTGTDRSPELSSIIYIIGKDIVLNRIDQAIDHIYEIYSC